MNIALLGLVTAILYFIAAFLLAVQLQQSHRRQANTGEESALAIQVPAILALFAHAVMLVNEMAANGLNFSFFNSLAIFAWLIAALLLLASLRWPLSALGVMVYPVAGLCTLGFGFAAATRGSVEAVSLAPAVEVHIAVSVFAYSMLSLAALQACLLALQDHHLHHHKTSPFVLALPPLQTMERLMFRLIEIGMVLLTLSLISGFYVVEDWWSHKILFSIIAWLIFTVLLVGRWVAGWRGRKAIRFTLAGISFLMLAFFGSKLVLEFILGR
ncbi:MAG: cytochrome C assembly family protein [Pseudomonadota bacterium]